MGVAPWDLLDREALWMDLALLFESAEAGAREQARQMAESEAQARMR